MIIRHKRSKDLCFETYVEGDEGEWIGKWINMGYVESWYIPGGIESIFVKDLSDWEVCTTPNIKCYRYGKWEEFK